MSDGGRVPPHNIQAEESLLGAMLLSRTAIEAALPHVVGADFYKPAHAQIFDAIAGLYKRGIETDVVSVAAELTSRGVLSDAGGPAALVGLQAATGATTSAKRYALIVSGLRAYRGIIAACTETTALAYDQDGDPADIADGLSRALAEVFSRVVAEKPDNLWVLDEFLDRPAEDRPQWVIPGLARVGWRVMLVAGEGSGKTVLWRQIGIAAAQGIHPLSFTPIPPVRTLIVDCENPEDSIHDVCQPIREQTALTARLDYDPDRAWLWHRPGGINLRSRRDRGELEAVIAEVQPDLVCLGPLYKVYSVAANENDEQAAKEVMECFDDLRTRYGFALLLEHHAPKGAGKHRDLMPYGSSLWLRWPELGIAMSAVTDDGKLMKLGRWRGDRLDNAWPTELERGNPWPWVGRWPTGTFNDPKGPPPGWRPPSPPPEDEGPIPF